MHFLFMHCAAGLSIHVVRVVSAALMHMQKSQTGCVCGFFYILMEKLGMIDKAIDRK